MLKEFRDFISKGNVLDLAVGIIIGAAFTSIVQSLVKDIITPIIGMAGKSDFGSMYLLLKEGETAKGPYASLDAAEKASAVVLKYGSFLSNVINFLIIAAVVFFIVKAANAVRKKPEVVVVSVPEPTKEEVLLTEIRDALLAQKKG